MNKFQRVICIVTLLCMRTSAISQNNQQVLASGQRYAGTFTDKYPYTVTEQNSSLCDAGSRQWTGTVNVTDDKSIFFWFFESRNDPDSDPIVLWLNGGPAATSMSSLFNEGGPCKTDGETTSRNEKTSWTNFANMIYIDQPAGSGLSVAQNGSEPVDNLDAGARDLNIVLNVLFGEVFVTFQHQPFHIAGESFGGHYLPFYAKRILELQSTFSTEAAPVNLTSIILYNAFIEHAEIYAGHYDMFCSAKKGEQGRETGFNTTTCEAIAAQVPHCLRMGRMCKETYDWSLCRMAAVECAVGIAKWFDAEVVPGGRSPYDTRIKCDEPPLCSDLGFGNTTKYLNRPDVQAKLGFHNLNFTPINFPLNSRWTEKADIWVPTTRELQYLLDTAEISVLVVNGNTDVIINTPGTIRIYDQLEWSGQARYRLEEFRDWKFGNEDGISKRGGHFKSAGRLTFIDVDEAGHQAPFHQPVAIANIMQRWTEFSGAFQL